jgi:hypothetical protein
MEFINAFATVYNSHTQSAETDDLIRFSPSENKRKRLRKRIREEAQ